MSNMEEQIKQAVLKLRDHCLATQQVVCTAESCTGGWVAQAITDMPGSSAWFDRGYVTYSNTAKQEMLHVDQQTLTQYGAVSIETVQAMVAGALTNCSAATLAVAISGVAGPDGGSPEKPVGTVCLAWGKPGKEIITAQHRWSGDRQLVRAQAVLCALEGLIR